MEKVLLNIISEQLLNGVSEGEFNFITEGTKQNKNNSTVISYAESEVFGFPDHTTEITLEDEKITLERMGKHNTKFEFENGKPFIGIYSSEFGTTNVNVLPLKVSYTGSLGSGEIELIYDIGIKDSRYRNKYFLKYKPLDKE